jgi:hypothetical protein
MTNAEKIADLQKRIAAAYHRETTESIPALVAALNALQMADAPEWVRGL